MRKFWITKWWDTKGIMEVEGEVMPGAFGSRSKYVSSGYICVPLGRDAFETEEEAKERVRSLAQKKIKNLQQKIDRLKKEQGL